MSYFYYLTLKQKCHPYQQKGNIALHLNINLCHFKRFYSVGSMKHRIGTFYFNQEILLPTKQCLPCLRIVGLKLNFGMKSITLVTHNAMFQSINQTEAATEW